MSSEESTRPAAIARLAALPIWPGAPRIAAIAGGRTNENFRVEAGGRSFFARLGVDLPHHGIRRANELRCARLAAEAGVAPEVVHAGDGVMVTAFVAGRTLVQGEPVADDVLRRLAQALRALAARPAPADLNVFDPVAVGRRDLAALTDGALPAARRARAAAILDGAPRLATTALIHADLIPENVIVSDTGLALVDWEYAGRGDPVVDVASVVLHFGLPAHQAAMFVATHGAADPATVAALQPVLALREALWCEVQQRHAGLRGDLADYTEMCWRRLDRVAP
ncbi:MAG: phosphotransferase [Alphaproteobacteria bacterium]|nr:phosphotransferase [Alphaproteobacteria bacterium]